MFNGEWTVCESQPIYRLHCVLFALLEENKINIAAKSLSKFSLNPALNGLIFFADRNLMSQFSLAQQELEPHFTLDFSSIRLTPEQFQRLCADNRDLRLELTSTGELIVMPPTGSKTGFRNAALTRQLGMWAEQDGTGLAFDSSTGFTLPNGAIRSPDACWIRRSCWECLNEEVREEFAPICPDFVVELRSPTDRLATLQAKMSEYLENGAQLGWIVDPMACRVYVYRPGEELEVLEKPLSVSGGPLLPGFVLNVGEIW